MPDLFFFFHEISIAEDSAASAWLMIFPTAAIAETLANRPVSNNKMKDNFCMILVILAKQIKSIG
jgi:hypothetical protein